MLETRFGPPHAVPGMMGARLGGYRRKERRRAAGGGGLRFPVPLPHLFNIGGAMKPKTCQSDVNEIHVKHFSIGRKQQYFDAAINQERSILIYVKKIPRKVWG